MSKVKLDKMTYEKAQEIAEKAGYATVEDLLTHLVEQEHAKLEGSQSDGASVTDRLKGLGYIE